MLVRMPYIYDAVVLERKCRYVSHGYFGDWQAVEVTETSEADLPVAMRWTEVSDHGRVETPRETRWFDDRHWMPYGRVDQPNCALTPSEDLLDGQKLYKIAKDALRYDYYRNLALQDFMGGDLRPFDGEHVNEVHYLDRESGVRSAEDAAADLLAVDGILYRSVPEPVYSLSWRNDLRGGEQRPSARISADMRQRRIDDGPFFRADRLEDMVDIFRMSHRRHVIRSKTEIEVLLPESVNFEDDRDAVRAAAARMVGKRADCFDGVYPQLRKMATESAVHWFPLRDALAAYDGSEEAADAMAGHLEKLTPAIEGGYIKDYCGFVLDRWRMRPVTEQSLRL